MNIGILDHHRIASIIISIAFAFSLGTLARAEFKPGNVFVSEPAYKNCRRGDTYGWDRIWEIDPYTGESSLFAELRDEECGVLSGLVFTPDACRLRASQFLTSRILEFDSKGNWTMVLDRNDGILGPLGSNNLAYDRDGNFYVAHYGRNIMKFPAGGGPSMVFADTADGVGGPGPLAVAETGDVYFGNWDYEGYILRITPEGVSNLFDPLKNFSWLPRGLSANRTGNLFMILTNGELYRYDLTIDGDRSLLAMVLAEYPIYASTGPIVLDPSETWLLVPVFSVSELIGLHIATGKQRVLANVSGASPAFGPGLAVVPVHPGDTDRDTNVDTSDFTPWERCVTGPQVGLVPIECALLDLNGDSDVDLADFTVFQQLFGGRREDCPTVGMYAREEVGAGAGHHGVHP